MADEVTIPIPESNTVVERQHDFSDKMVEHEGRLTRSEEQLTRHTEDMQRNLASLEERLMSAINEGNKAAVEGLTSRIGTLESQLTNAATELETLKAAKATETVVETPASLVEGKSESTPDVKPKEEHKSIYERRKERRSK